MKYRNFGKDNQLLLFDILNYIVEQGNMNIWVPVSSKKFLTFILDILKSENDAEIQTKLLQLIQCWGMDFENKKDVIPNFFKIYNKFKTNGVVFPPREESNYYKYILKEEPQKQNNNNNNYRNYRDEFKDNNQNKYFEEEHNYNDSNENDEFEYMESIKNQLKVSNFDHKYRRLVAYLVKMHDNIKIANICIDKKRLNDLKEPISAIKKGNKTIMDTITSGRLKDEKLMEITLGTTEDINQTLSREEEMRSGNRPNKFISYFVLNEIIPITNNKTNKARAKSEKKKVSLNQKNNINRDEQDNFPNKNSNNNIQNVDDIFDLFSTNKPQPSNDPSNFPNNIFNNNNQNSNNFMDSNNNNFNFNSNNRMNNNTNSNNNNQNQMNNFDLLQGSINMNDQQNNNNFNQININNNPNKRNNSNEFEMYGPSPEINSNQLIHYIGPIDNNNNNNNNNNNPYPNFDSGNPNNNMFSQNNQGNQSSGNGNIMENNFGNDMNNGPSQQMTQEDIEREQRLKELDDLF